MRSSEEVNGAVPSAAATGGGSKVVVVMPAYNAGRTLRMTYTDLPHDTVDMVILVDDGSTDDTVAVARELNLKLFLHDRNYGYGANRFLTGVENWAFGLHLSEYHTGYRAYRREVLEAVNFTLNADKFIFDQEIMAQVVEAGFRIAEVPVPTRYFAEASSASFLASTRYGLGILWLVSRYLLHRRGTWAQRQFQSLRGRYRELA